VLERFSFPLLRFYAGTKNYPPLFFPSLSPSTTTARVDRREDWRQNASPFPPSSAPFFPAGCQPVVKDKRKTTRRRPPFPPPPLPLPPYTEPLFSSARLTEKEAERTQNVSSPRGSTPLPPFFLPLRFPRQPANEKRKADSLAESRLPPFPAKFFFFVNRQRGTKRAAQIVDAEAPFSLFQALPVPATAVCRDKGSIEGAARSSRRFLSPPPLSRPPPLPRRVRAGGSRGRGEQKASFPPLFPSTLIPPSAVRFGKTHEGRNSVRVPLPPPFFPRAFFPPLSAVVNTTEDNESLGTSFFSSLPPSPDSGEAVNTSVVITI